MLKNIFYLALILIILNVYNLFSNQKVECLGLFSLVFSLSIDSLRHEAELGNMDAILELGNRYYNGQGVPKSYKKAYEIFEKIKDNMFAQYNIGVLYEEGYKDFPKDSKKADYWYNKAKKQGLLYDSDKPKKNVSESKNKSKYTPSNHHDNKFKDEWSGLFGWSDWFP